MVKEVVWSVILYGSVMWTMKEDVCQKFEAFEMWSWRRME